MLITLEGPDRAGKTTLFNTLRTRVPGVVFVPSLGMDERLLPVIDLCEERAVHLWEHLYDPKQIYLCDRCPFVSNVVYAHVYCRTPRRYPKWAKELRVLYVHAPEELLHSRRDGKFPQDAKTVLAVYDSVIRCLIHTRIDATLLFAAQIQLCLDAIEAWRNSPIEKEVLEYNL